MRIIGSILAAFIVLLTPSVAVAHCNANTLKHKRCGNPPPKISSPGVNPTWRPKDTDFASKAEFDEAIASYQSELAAAQAKNLITPAKAMSLKQQSQTLKANSRFKTAAGTM